MDEGNDCTFEVCLVDTKRWWNIFDVFSPLPNNTIAVRYDHDHYVIFKGRHCKMVKADKIKKYVTHTEKTKTICKCLLVGRMWLDSCLHNKTEFKSSRDFLEYYVKIMNGVKSGQ